MGLKAHSDIVRGMDQISFSTFEQVEMRTGTVLRADPFPEAKRPAYKLTIDFGAFGIRQSSAQITTLYLPEELIGKQVVAILNLGPKKIAGFVSECLVAGLNDENGNVVLICPQMPVPNGARLY